MISILILTKNEENDLPGCLESVAWSDDIHVYDSLSTDRTVEIAEAAGATVTRRAFDNWSAHQNWGLKNIPFRHDWVFYIDADERMTAALQSNVLAAIVRSRGQCGIPGQAAGFPQRHLAETRADFALLPAPVPSGKDALRTSRQSGEHPRWPGRRS